MDLSESCLCKALPALLRTSINLLDINIRILFIDFTQQLPSTINRTRNGNSISFLLQTINSMLNLFADGQCLAYIIKTIHTGTFPYTIAG